MYMGGVRITAQTDHRVTQWLELAKTRFTADVWARGNEPQFDQ